MNRILGEFNFNITIGENKITQNEFIKGGIQIATRRLKFLSYTENNLFYDIQKKLFCSIIGYITNLEYLREKYKCLFYSDVEIITYLFFILSESIFNEIEGSFTIIIWNEKENKLYLFQDEFGSYLPLYYTIQNKRFMFSTSLKEILRSFENRQLNITSVKSFLSPFRDRFGSFKPNCLVPNENTLISNIYKLLPNQVLIFDCKQFSYQIRDIIRKKHDQYTFEESKDNLIKSIQKQTNNLVSLIQIKDTISSTLSSGYDSNLIMHFLSNNDNIKTINAITIGGKLRNEIPKAKKCIENLKNVNHHKKVVSNDRLNLIPEIIWRTDGYVSERGLILVYEIAEILSLNNLNTVFLSDCADQILNKYSTCAINSDLYNFQLTEQDYVKNSYIELFFDDNISIKYDVDLDYILKKSGILLNSFSLQPIYPFLNSQTKAYANIIHQINKRKHFYIQEIEKIMPHNTNYLKKIGGTTDIEYLFNKHPNIVDILLKKDIIRQLLSDKQITFIHENSYSYIKILLNVLFIHVFNELFISGKYDNFFENSDLKFSLNEFI